MLLLVVGLRVRVGSLQRGEGTGWVQRGKRGGGSEGKTGGGNTRESSPFLIEGAESEGTGGSVRNGERKKRSTAKSGMSNLERGGGRTGKITAVKIELAKKIRWNGEEGR